MTKKRDWPAMVTRDGHELEIDQLLYQPNVTVSNYSEEKHSAEIEVFRVIDLNLQHRTVRLRCHKGCESFFKLDQTCNRNGYYADKKNAEAEVKRLVNVGLKNLQEKIDDLTGLVAKATKLKAKMGQLPA